MKNEKSTIGILTNFQEFNPGYSLTGIVVEQALMLLRQGHKVFIFVNERFNPAYNADAGISRLFEKYPEDFKILKSTKFMHLTDYETKVTISNDHESAAIAAGIEYAKAISDHKINIIYTHDFIFTGWNLPYSFSIIEADKILKRANLNVKWNHWVHSVPSIERRDWWDINVYGENHFIVFPNNIEMNRVCESFGTNPSRVKIIPHIKDIRTWYDFSEETWDFIDAYPSLLDSTIIQIYPVSTDRMAAKQLQLVIQIFGYLKEAKISVCLCAANQWATGRQRKEDVEKYILLAENFGLEYGKDFIFTSEFSGDQGLSDIIEESTSFNELDKQLPVSEEWTPLRKKIIDGINWDGKFDEEKVRLLQLLQPYSNGISRKMLRQLQLLSNLFIFPTREESFGLVAPEAALSGALCVINRSLIMQYEVMGTKTPAFDFGSHHNTTEAINDPKYMRGVAHAILNRVYCNEALLTKIYCRLRYNMDSIYHSYYIPHAV